jgi:hypothetical protein
MKKGLLKLMILTILTGYCSVSSGQGVGVDVTAMYGYNFNDKFDVYEGYGEVSDGGVFTGIISFALNPKYDIELYYSRQEAEFDFDYYYNFNGFNTSGKIRNEPASVNYIQIGGCRNQALDAVGKAIAFGGINLGTMGLVPEASNYDDIWKFAFGLKAGLKYFFSDKVGMRIQTQMQVPVLYTSGSIWVGTGGASVGMSAGSTITQFGFSGGLIYRLK